MTEVPWEGTRPRPTAPLLDHVQRALNYDLVSFAHGYASLRSGLRVRAACDIGCTRCRCNHAGQLGNTRDGVRRAAFAALKRFEQS